MAKTILALVMLVFGALQLLIPQWREAGGYITGHIWVVGSIILSWMPAKQ